MGAFAHRDDLQKAAIDQRRIGDKLLPVEGGSLAMFASDRLGAAYCAHRGTGEVVIVVHGALRNADHYFHAIEVSARAAEREPFIIAPQFLTTHDLPGPRPKRRLLYWETEDWKGGLGRISSFTVMDALLERLRTMPGLNRITIAGNSAGGQFVNRYAAVGKGPDLVGVPVRFIVANPSTYLYFDRRRLSGGRFVEWPEAAVDQWRYGFSGAPAYVTESPDDCFAKYVGREVVYLLGGEDADPGAVLLEVHPAALAQGRTRRERGENYYAYLADRAGGPVHELVIAEGVGHDAEALFGSPEGQRCLFP